MKYSLLLFLLLPLSVKPQDVEPEEVKCTCYVLSQMIETAAKSNDQASKAIYVNALASFNSKYNCEEKYVKYLEEMQEAFKSSPPILIFPGLEVPVIGWTYNEVEPYLLLDGIIKKEIDIQKDLNEDQLKDLRGLQETISNTQLNINN
jgi:hypothetical protein